MNEGVEYREWPRDPRYKAGSDGSIVGPRGRVLKPFLHKRSGYLFVTGPTTKQRSARCVYVHTIVAEAWHGLRPDGLEVAHGNGVPTNCRPENLRWASHPENMSDMIKHGRSGRGVGGPKLSEKDVREIRVSYAAGNTSHYKLADQYGVTSQTIGYIVRRQTWKHVGNEVLLMKTAIKSSQRIIHPGGQVVSLWKNSTTKQLEQPTKIPA